MDWIPPEVLIEIEDIEAEIEQLQAELKAVEEKAERTIQQKKPRKPIRAKIFADVDIGNIQKGDATIGLFWSGKALIKAISEWASLDPKKFDYSWFLLDIQRSRQDIDDLDKLGDDASPGSILYLSNNLWC